MSITNSSSTHPLFLAQTQDIKVTIQCLDKPKHLLNPSSPLAGTVIDANNSQDSLPSNKVSWHKNIFNWFNYLTLSFLTLGIYSLVCKFSDISKIITEQAQEIKALQRNLRLQVKIHADQYNALNDTIDSLKNRLKTPSNDASMLFSAIKDINTENILEQTIVQQLDNSNSRNMTRRNSVPSIYPARQHTNRSTNTPNKENTNKYQNRFSTPTTWRQAALNTSHNNKTF